MKWPCPCGRCFDVTTDSVLMAEINVGNVQRQLEADGLRQGLQTDRSHRLDNREFDCIKVLRNSSEDDTSCVRYQSTKGSNDKAQKLFWAFLFWDNQVTVHHHANLLISKRIDFLDNSP